MVRGDLQRARVLAAKKQREYRAVFAGNKMNASNDYELHEGNQRAGSTAWTLSREGSFSDYPGVTVVAAATADPVFTPRGTASSDATITLQNNKGVQKQIQVLLAGRIRIN